MTDLAFQWLVLQLVGYCVVSSVLLWWMIAALLLNDMLGDGGSE